MHISQNWLKDFLDIKEDPKILANNLTLKTAEVESFQDESKSYENIVVGFILEVHAHPDADKLKIAKTSIGKDTHMIVCGGENLKEGMYVAVALPGSEVDWHGEGKKMKIEKSKIRGVESFGMICASSEIGLTPSENEGEHDILDLSPLNPKPGTPIAELLEKNDIIYEFDNKTLTNRPDLWGHYGIAREISVLTGEKLKEYKTDVKIPKTGNQIDVSVHNPELCPRYCGLIIDNVTIEDSPNWLKKRLKACGHGIHNNIVDVTNYIMSELGQPMHAFDYSSIKGKIVVRTAVHGEKIKALDDKTYNLKETNLIIADIEKPIAIAGVIGGKDSSVNKNTTKIILEAANFNPGSVRKTSTQLGVRTDSVQRFEKSLDPHMTEPAIKKAAELILKLCPNAKILGPITDISNFDTKPLKTKLSIKKLHSKIGVEINKTLIIEILEKLEFKIKKVNEDILEVEIPTFRATKDVEMEDDLIEEVARIYGYEHIPAIIPVLPTRVPLENTERKNKHIIRTILSLGLGFNEVYNYSFYGKKDLENCLMNEDSHLLLENFLSENHTHLRTTLIPNLLTNIQTNIKNFNEFKIFEIGRTYKEIGDIFPLEEKKIAGTIVKKGKTDKIFYKGKSVINEILNSQKIKGIKEVSEIKNTPFGHPKKSISYLYYNGETIATLFTLHPLVQKNYGLEDYSVVMFEINFSKLMTLANSKFQYSEIPKFPKIEFDISVIINSKTEIKTIHDEIKKVDKKLITNIELFDIYEGKNIPENKKAVAFKITLQSPEKTLTDQEMTEIQNKIFNSLEKIGGEIRGR